MIFIKDYFRIYNTTNLFINRFIINKNNELTNKDKDIDRI